MATNDKLKAELDDLGVAYPSRATKRVLMALLDEALSKPDPATDEPELEPAPEPEPEITAADAELEAPQAKVAAPPEPEVTTMNTKDPSAPIQGNAAVTQTADTACPPMDPTLGDKTPAVVAWRKANWKPVDFQRVYAGRKLDK